MKAVAVLLVTLTACGSSKSAPPPAPKNEFERFERAFTAQMKLDVTAMRAHGEQVRDEDVPTTYRAVFVGPSGVFVDRTLVATLAELETKRTEIVAAVAANAKLLPTIGWRPSVTFDLDAEPASVAISALRLFAGREMNFSLAIDDPNTPPRASETLCNVTTLVDAPRSHPDNVELSILLDTERIWLGLSRVNEFWDLADRPDGERDFEKLETSLRQQKQTAFFSERRDLELGAKAGTSRDVLLVLGIACKVGFPDIAVLPVAQLSAVPSL